MGTETIVRDTAELSLEGGRVAGSPGSRRAAEYLTARMEETGMKPLPGLGFRLPYTHEGRTFANLAGVIPGEGSGEGSILLGAHYDSAIEAPCSDDNAAAAALLLEIASRLRETGLSRPVVFAFFDAEEQPFFGTGAMGSMRFAGDHGHKISAAVILDAIGHRFELMVPVLDRTFRRISELIFVSGAEDHPCLAPSVEETARRARGLRVVPVLGRYIGHRSDDMAFRESGIPCLFISRGSGRHTHTQQDDMDWVDFRAVSLVGEWVLNLIRRLDEDCPEGIAVPAETFEMEKRMLKRALGPLLPGLLLYLGIRKFAPKSRQDMDDIALRLRKYLKIK